MTPSPVVILGMHRSGTSCLAGSLEEAGLFLGQVDHKRHTNLKGNRENMEIMRLGNAVLEANDATWNTPPEGPCQWSPEHADWRDRLIAQYPADRAWGFKDPRTLLLLEGWLEALPGARLVGTFRHPLRVARSLQDRNGFEIARGLDLWMAYNRRLLQAMTARDMPLVCFDWSAERYNTAVHGIALGLGLQPPEAGFTFFETSLRHSLADPDAELPAEVQTVYRDLLDRADAASERPVQEDPHR